MRCVTTNMSGVVMARRDGGIYHDTEVPDRYVETFLVSSWAEHLRQHARLTQADRKLEDRVRTLVRGEPRIQHLIDARRDMPAHPGSDD